MAAGLNRTCLIAALLAGLVGPLCIAASVPDGAAASTLPAGFNETTAFSDLSVPTVVRFAPDGRVFVAEKTGLIKVFDGPGDNSATTYADLRVEVDGSYDRGLLGMALSPYYSEHPWIYVLYTLDTADTSTTMGRLSVLKPTPGGTVTEEVLIEDWCQQYLSHSVGSLEFDQWGSLYASAGDGASFEFADWGQSGDPANPCGDPPGPAGSALSAPDAEGGALRSQDIRTASDPAGLNGSIIRVDPLTGEASPDNPLYESSDANARRILAAGLRNPFRFAIDEQGDVWAGDVGWGVYEEINLIQHRGLTNLGWPCYEAQKRHGAYESAGLSICEGLYQSGEAEDPYFFYRHRAEVAEGDNCPTGSSSLAGVEFMYNDLFPSRYRGALFFADYSRDCVWAMLAEPGERPDPRTVETFATEASNPVFLETAPDGALYYPDVQGGRIQRISYTDGNQPPTAVATADPQSGPLPLAVTFDGSGSRDPDTSDELTYAWDLDGDSELDDSNEISPSFTYADAGSFDVRLRVTDGAGATSDAEITVDAGNSPPTPVITSPTRVSRWDVGSTVNFTGAALDSEDGALDPSALRWDLRLEHCPSNCHTHPVRSWVGVDSGSFVAPDHEYPTHLVIRLTATDSLGSQSSESVRVDPRTATILLRTEPRGMKLALNGDLERAPVRTPVITGSTNSLSAPATQRKRGRTYEFKKWRHGGGASQVITASGDGAYKAVYSRIPGSR